MDFSSELGRILILVKFVPFLKQTYIGTEGCI